MPSRGVWLHRHLHWGKNWPSHPWSGVHKQAASWALPVGAAPVGALQAAGQGSSSPGPHKGWLLPSPAKSVEQEASFIPLHRLGSPDNVSILLCRTRDVKGFSPGWGLVGSQTCAASLSL